MTQVYAEAATNVLEERERERDTVSASYSTYLEISLQTWPPTQKHSLSWKSETTSDLSPPHVVHT